MLRLCALRPSTAPRAGFQAWAGAPLVKSESLAGAALAPQSAASAFTLQSPCRFARGRLSGSGSARDRATRAFAAAAGGGRPPAPEPVDTTTALDSQRALRAVERRIEEHVQKAEREAAAGVGSVDEGAATTADAGAATAPSETSGTPSQEKSGEREASEAAPLVPAAASPLRLRDPNAPAPGQDGGKDVIVRSRTTTGQVLWPATPEDIEILSESKLLYPAPYEVEGSVIIRLVRLSDPVTSPVGRVMRNRQFGIRGNEKWQLLGMGAVCACIIYSLGFWQLRRMEWKAALLEMRRERLGMPRIAVTVSPFPWRDCVQDYVCRVVDVRGVFDHRREMFVGPRPGLDSSGDTQAGYNVVTPLRLEDGSSVLVNRGHLPFERIDQATRPEVPAWVRVRGVLEDGEVASDAFGSYARLKNRPDKGEFVYLVPSDLAENANARNHEECGQALLTAIDVLYEDDFKAGVRRELPFSMKHKEDYLLFWADEHTHFNYAMQWFGMGTLILVMTVYKFIEVSRWRW